MLAIFYLGALVFSMYAGANLAMRVEIPRSLLEKVRVGELMVRHTDAVAAGDTLAQVAEHMRLERRQALPVVEQGQVVGLVTLEAVRRIPVAERARRRVREVARPVPAVTPEASAWDALLEMGQYGVLQLPVVEEGVLVGTVSEEDVARELKLRELGEPLASGTRRHPVLAEHVLPTDVTPVLTFELATPRGISLRVHAFFRWLLGLWVLFVLPSYAFFRSFPGATDTADGAVLSVWGLGLWGLGGLVALALTGLAHELGHVFYALRKGGQVSEITLLMVGGVSRITGLPGGLKQEVSMALAGLATSLMMGVLFLGVGALLPGGASSHPSNPSLAFMGLGLFNLFVGFWNLLPSFPLDGGRLLRALLTGKLGRSRATRVVGWLGKGLAVLLAVGLFSFFFPLLLALSLYAGIKRETRALWMEPLLARVRAKELMVRHTGAVAAEDTLAQVARRMLLDRRQALPVVDQGQVVGLVTLEMVRRIPVAERARRRVREVARRVPAVTPEASAWDALLEMGQCGVPQLPVVEEGVLVGTLSGAEVERELTLRELREPRGSGPRRLVPRESPA
ncbi:CBS domain-containing protein [Archangium gephyra]|uniref:CBS domain-containing protein n=1 Tax=Archangium gephyra TaxID=48 RepID=UPI0009E308B2|nr:CBS domain-containing protein [Archangium gephyra]